VYKGRVFIHCAYAGSGSAACRINLLINGLVDLFESCSWTTGEKWSAGLSPSRCEGTSIRYSGAWGRFPYLFSRWDTDADNDACKMSSSTTMTPSLRVTVILLFN